MAICVAAAYLVMGYDFQPGQIGSQRADWPVGTAVPHSADRLTALMFIHPRCVCTAASVKQLVRAIRQHPGADLTAVVFTPADGANKPEWEEGDYIKSIRAAIPNARLVFDRGGAEARRFGAFTSGTVLVYDRAGNEIFRGGITDKRGGEGDNPGLQKLGKTLENGVPRLDIGTTPVFGCPIVPRDEEEKS